MTVWLVMCLTLQITKKKLAKLTLYELCGHLLIPKCRGLSNRDEHSKEVD